MKKNPKNHKAEECSRESLVEETVVHSPTTGIILGSKTPFSSDSPDDMELIQL